MKVAFRRFLPIFGIKPSASVPSLHMAASSNNPNVSTFNTSRFKPAFVKVDLTS